MEASSWEGERKRLSARYLESENIKTFSQLLYKQKLTQEGLKQLATKKQQQVGNITQIEDAAEKLKASGCYFLIPLRGPHFPSDTRLSPRWRHRRWRLIFDGANQFWRGRLGQLDSKGPFGRNCAAVCIRAEENEKINPSNSYVNKLSPLSVQSPLLRSLWSDLP